jgi:hypothetical protein
MSKLLYLYLLSGTLESEEQLQVSAVTSVSRPEVVSPSTPIAISPPIKLFFQGFVTLNFWERF